MLVCLIRSIILYLLLVFAIRMMGKRQIGEMEPSEFVVALLIADLASVPMQDLGIPLLGGVIPILTVLTVELLLSVLTYYSVFFRRLFCGKPVILMENGKILQKNLKKTRLTPDELTEHLREKDIMDLNTVKYAILETNGQISTMLYAKHQPPTAKDLNVDVKDDHLPVTLISGGQLLKKNLAIADRSELWVEGLLKKHQCTVKQVFLLTVDQAGQIYLVLKEAV